MMKIKLQSLGKVDITVVTTLKERLLSSFGCPVVISASNPVPPAAYNQERGQYLSDALFQSMENPDNIDHEIVLGISDVDMYTSDMNFIFGQADMKSGKAVISLYRLRQDVSEDLFLDRIVKESVHELGHLLGLDHCRNSACVMHFSNTLQDTDNKASAFCNECRPRLLK